MSEDFLLFKTIDCVNEEDVRQYLLRRNTVSTAYVAMKREEERRVVRKRNERLRKLRRERKLQKQKRIVRR